MGCRLAPDVGPVTDGAATVLHRRGRKKARLAYKAHGPLHFHSSLAELIISSVLKM